MAADFELPDDWREWAVGEGGLTVAEAEDEGEAFRDYWHAKAGKDAAKADWTATWRNWVRNSRRRAPPRWGGRVNGPQPAVPL
ncbi:hypothetical protein [Sphingomonas baiyangensis]|uniref:Uncharacterized protein n=1 Tax=Sphingomonas baiyangensis TaxID=2572576 RepID=A0A4U1L2G3_9SPHN|nr:hypothetical protein [Sphingomonas baiyangensis]TKD50205.1 hypothetical protein FBR43_05130 [Sphingomonas baiyangensis]